MDSGKSSFEETALATIDPVDDIFVYCECRCDAAAALMAKRLQALGFPGRAHFPVGWRHGGLLVNACLVVHPDIEGNGLRSSHFTDA